MDPGIINWLRLADYEAASAQTLLEGGKTLYVVFTCHQAAEKALKALVTHKINTVPPRTHDLLWLSEKTGIEIPARFGLFLVYLNQGFMTVRYPLDLDEAMASFTLESVTPLVAQIKEFIAWVRSQLESKK